MAPPPPWSDIPLELAGLVLRHLPVHVDRVRFAAVCRQWRAATRDVPLPSPLPLLALLDGTMYSFPGSGPLHFPGCTGYTDACGSNWLAFSTVYGSFLRDPFSNATVILPPLFRVPAPRRRSFGSPLRLQCASQGRPPGGRYMIKCFRCLMIWHSTKESSTFSVSLIMAFMQWTSVWIIEREVHGFVKFNGFSAASRKTYGALSSWLVAGTFIPSGRIEFDVFCADFQQSKWTKVTTIGDDQVLFLRKRCSRFVHVSPEEMPGDRIVFLDNDDEDPYHDWYEQGASNSCKVYNMRDGTVSPFVPSVRWERSSVPATWLLPRL